MRGLLFFHVEQLNIKDVTAKLLPIMITKIELRQEIFRFTSAVFELNCIALSVKCGIIVKMYLTLIATDEQNSNFTPSKMLVIYFASIEL